ncbi:hypothetical protein GLYMA_17G056550v4 [Glycine max]|nr:hypothetical protein GLYMA_17G056550v4 [Glycine max]KAH1116957.1 hypothetical protein GYH30_046364 [Glycine max]
MMFYNVCNLFVFWHITQLLDSCCMSVELTFRSFKNFNILLLKINFQNVTNIF